MASKDIFCNIPWFELNINNDGSFDLCGCQNDKIINTDLGQEWNIKRMGIDEYWNSSRMREKRKIKLGDTVDPMCRMCQMKDAAGYTSARQKENLKSVIFQRQFDRSFAQSPHKGYFDHSLNNDGETVSRIASLHLNIGSACNFSCKFCAPEASSRVAQDQRKLGWILPDYRIEPWTQDARAWQRFVDWFEVNYESVRVVHIIGGEPELIERFRDLLNMFADKNMSWLNLSFTTNGSIDYSKYHDQLKIFRRVEIGVSIETADRVNDYVREGGSIVQILHNVDHMRAAMPDVQWTFRTVPTVLSVLRYHTLLEHALSRGISIDASYPHRPRWMLSSLLPQDLKAHTIQHLQDFANSIKITGQRFNNTKNPNNVGLTLKSEAEALIEHLRKPEPDNANELRRELAARLSEQDDLYNKTAEDYLPEIVDWLRIHGYRH
jgi:MoaA/NifB/PqqE/SkfB family radical SAM enzyme